MKKEIFINGMKCEHCKARVEKALNAIADVKAEVNLETNSAIVEIDSEEVDEHELANAVKDAGYEVESIDTIEE